VILVQRPALATWGPLGRLPTPHPALRIVTRFLTISSVGFFSSSRSVSSSSMASSIRDIEKFNSGLSSDAHTVRIFLTDARL
jgi:hypothetical protein